MTTRVTGSFVSSRGWNLDVM